MNSLFESTGIRSPLASFREMAIAAQNTIRTAQMYWNGVLKYTGEFMNSILAAQSAAMRKDREEPQVPVWEKARCYADLFEFNLMVGAKGAIKTLEAVNAYHLSEMSEAFKAWLNTFCNGNEEDIVQYTSRRMELVDLVVNDYPAAIRDIRPEYGFHFDNGNYVKTAETDRFVLYQVLPLEKNVRVNQNGKPIIIVPPYVLGPNILAFLPNERRSYVHRFANEGIPTYMRIVKDIATTVAVQTMAGEDDVLDTRFFSEKVKARHGKPLTLNGYCQGGLLTVLAILSGELEGLVDAHITCASPMDGTRSEGFVEYMNSLPECAKSLKYAQKTLPNGNEVVDGRLMSLVYKLKSIDKEAPLLSFYRDLKMFDRPGKEMRINKIASALNHWLFYDLRDLPSAITQLSYQSYTTPVTEDGALPMELFGRRLNFKRINEMGVKWLICYAEEDTLVERDAALAPLDYIKAEICIFPKGHVSMATSVPVSPAQWALNTCFPGNINTCGRYRDPVRFQLDLSGETEPGGEDEAPMLESTG
jgi:hypothetical protein